MGALGCLTHRSRLSVMRATLREQSTPAGLNQWNMRPASVRAPVYAATVMPEGGDHEREGSGDEQGEKGRVTVVSPSKA